MNIAIRADASDPAVQIALRTVQDAIRKHPDVTMQTVSSGGIPREILLFGSGLDKKIDVEALNRIKGVHAYVPTSKYRLIGRHEPPKPAASVPLATSSASELKSALAFRAGAGAGFAAVSSSPVAGESRAAAASESLVAAWRPRSHSALTATATAASSAWPGTISSAGAGAIDGLSSRRGWTYNGVTVDDSRLTLFPGLCAVDGPESVEAVMRALRDAGINTTRMGAYKPRTSPYDFQGLGKACLPYVFKLADKYDIKAICMEVVDAGQIDEIRSALRETGSSTGVILQIGTRNAQNFSLLKAVGRAEFPVLYKRGMGLTLDESLSACEYVASEGNTRIAFCLRGVATRLSAPHRNLVDFAHVPVVKRLTHLPVCVDPSHSVGTMSLGPDGLPDIFHATGQGIIAGANMVLVDFHPTPSKALCDGPQALLVEQLPTFVRYCRTLRAAYEQTVAFGAGLPAGAGAGAASAGSGAGAASSASEWESKAAGATVTKAAAVTRNASSLVRIDGAAARAGVAVGKGQTQDQDCCEAGALCSVVGSAGAGGAGAGASGRLGFGCAAPQPLSGAFLTAKL